MDESSTHGDRIRACAEIVRRSPVSGVVLGDSRMHDPRAMSADDFEAMWSSAERYAMSPPGVFFAWQFMMNTAEDTHACIHVRGRPGRHFGFPEAVADHAPVDYWRIAAEVHRTLGLTLGEEPCLAWVSLAPAEQAEIFVYSQSLPEGARFVHRLLRTPHLRSHGLALTAYLSHGVTDDSPQGRFSQWPPVLWRLVVSGRPLNDPLQPDHEPMPMDPFAVIEWLKGTITW